MKHRHNSILAAAAAALAFTASGETNLASEAVRRTHVSAYADIETAYWARGAIVDKRPFSAQYADLSFDLDPFGRIGGYAWSVSSLSKSGQSATRSTPPRRRSPARTSQSAESASHSTSDKGAK